MSLHSKLDVNTGDVVILMSDGHGDCLATGEIMVMLTAAHNAGHEASRLAETIVNAAIDSGVKVDDMSCVVGYVQEVPQKRQRCV